MIPTSPLKNGDLFKISNLEENNLEINKELTTNISNLTSKKDEKSIKEIIIFSLFLAISISVSILQGNIDLIFKNNYRIAIYYTTLIVNPGSVDNFKAEYTDVIKYMTRELGNKIISPITNFRLKQIGEVSPQYKSNYYLENNEYVYYLNIYKNDGSKFIVKNEDEFKIDEELKSIGFFNNKIKSSTIDISFYNPSTDILITIMFEYEFSDIGVITRNIEIYSFIRDVYNTHTDYVRSILEILFLLFLIYYIIVDFLSIYLDNFKNTLVFNKKQEQTEKKNCFSIFFDLVIKFIIGASRYFSVFLNLLSFITHILGIIIISYWIYIYNNYRMKIVDLSLKLKTPNSNINDFNELCYITGKYLYIYYFPMVGIFLLISIVRYLIIITLSSKKLTKYSNLIKEVYFRIIVFLALIMGIFVGFTIFLKNMFGFDLPDFSIATNVGIYLIFVILGDNSKMPEMWEISPILTAFFYLFFFCIMIFIFMNLPFVMLKEEFTNHKLKNQERKLKENVQKIENNQFIYKKCLFERIKNVFKNIKILITKLFYPEKYKIIIETRKNFEEELKKESQNYLDTPFDTNFQDFVKGLQDKQKAETEIERYIKRKGKMGLKVQKIWQTLGNIIIFLVFSTLVNYYFRSDSKYVSNNTIYQLIEKIQPNYLLDNEKLIKDHIKYNFTTLFKEYYYSTKPIPTDILNKTDVDVSYGLLDQYFLINNKIRITVRRRKEKDIGDVFVYPDGKISLENSFEYDSAFDSDIEYSDKIFDNEFIFSESFNENGGYVVYIDLLKEYPERKIENLIDIHISSVVIDFVLVNLDEESNEFLYCLLVYKRDQTGNIIFQININNFNRNTIEKVSDLLLLSFLILISVLYLFLLTNTIRSLIFRNNNYNTWFTLYIGNRLPQILLFHRERKDAEIIRKLKYLFNFKLIVDCLFLVFDSGFLICVIVYEFQIFFFEINAVIFNKSVKTFIYDQIFYNPEINDYYNVHFGELINKCTNIHDTFNGIALFTMGMCVMLFIKLMIFFRENRIFYIIMKTLILFIPKFIILSIFLIFLSIAHTFSLHFYLGYKNELLSNIEFAVYISFQVLMNFENLSLPKDDINLLIILIIPYFITFKLIWINFFIVFLYSNFEKAKNISIEKFDKDKEIYVTPLEFLKITLNYFKIQKKTKNLIKDNRNQEVISNILKKFNAHIPFIRMKNTLRVADKSTNINVWASLCAEEILFESEHRSILKDKCDEIIRNLMKMENDIEDTTYFKLKKGSTARIPIEFELRKTYWEYFRVGHLYLNRYDSYFKIKIDDIIEKNKIEASLNIKKDDNENEGKNFEKEEEENLKFLYREFEDKLLELKKLKEIEDELKKKLE